MEKWERERYIARIIAGEMRILIDNKIFIIKKPSLSDKYMAEEIFFNQIEKAKAKGALTEEELFKLLKNNKIWNKEEEEKLDKTKDNIEKLKMGIFEKRFKSKEVATIRQFLKKTKEEYLRLETIKHSYDHLTVNGVANASKQRYLLGCSVYLENGEPYWKGISSWETPDEFLNKIKNLIIKNSLSEEQFREIARTDPWVTRWSLRKYCNKGIFDCTSVDLTDDQTSLMVWSSIYESIREHPDVLDDETINDDDMIDGWLLIKKKEKESGKNTSSSTKNSKIKDAPEQFIPVDTIEDAQKIINMNDHEGLSRLKTRMNAIKQNGQISEQEMPDVIADQKKKAYDNYVQYIKGR